YCIENSILDPATLAEASGRSIEEVQTSVVNAFQTKRKSIFQKNKFFEFLAEKLTAEHMTFERLKTFDASLVLEDVIASLGLSSVHAALPKYLQAAKKRGRLEVLFPKQLLGVLSAGLGKTKAAVEEIPAPRDESPKSHESAGAGGRVRVCSEGTYSGPGVDAP